MLFPSAPLAGAGDVVKPSPASPLVRMARRLPTGLRGRLKPLYRRHLRTGRLLSSPLRMQPDFFVIGTMKGGTTSLHSYLNAFPDVLMGFKKEIEYFDAYPDRSELWYRSHFPLRPRSITAAARLAAPPRCGEATPGYLAHPDVPARVANMYPAAELIALLRDPVERAVSHHNAMVASGREQLGLLDAVERELSGKPTPREVIRRGGPEMKSSSFRLHSYYSRGLYAEQLDRWLERFPRDALLIVRSEDLFADPGSTVRRVRSFLGLAEAASEPAYEVHNPAHHVPSDIAEAQQLDAGRERLRDLYRGPNADLVDRYGISWGDES